MRKNKSWQLETILLFCGIYRLKKVPVPVRQEVFQKSQSNKILIRASRDDEFDFDLRPLTFDLSLTLAGYEAI